MPVANIVSDELPTHGDWWTSDYLAGTRVPIGSGDYTDLP